MEFPLPICLIREVYMPNYDWECKNGHIFERIVSLDQERAKCSECGCMAEKIWLSPKSPHRQLQNPIVMWRYSDGSLGVAGGADSRTPKGAERVEIRSIGDYRRYAKELNRQHREIEERRDERYLEAKEHMEHERRSRLSYLMGQESDPHARALYREALERNKGGRERPSFSEYFSVAMEMDPSNYERD